MSYKFTTGKPKDRLSSIVKTFFVIEFDEDTTRTDYLLPDGLPSFFYIQTSEPIDAYFGETGQTTCLRSGLYIGYSNTVVEFAHKRLKIIGASVFPVYLKMIFGKSPLDLINSFSRLDKIDTFSRIEGLLTTCGSSFAGIFTLFEKYITEQLNRHEFKEDFLVVYEKLTAPGGYQLSVEELAAVLGYSSRYLHTRFKKLMGMPPKKFIKLVRFNHALKHIYEMTGDTSLSYIAHEVGYHDQSHFIRDFKQICGKTPKELAGNTDSLANKFRLF